MSYVDGFLLAVPKANLDAYKKMATDAGAVPSDGPLVRKTNGKL